MRSNEDCQRRQYISKRWNAECERYSINQKRFNSLNIPLDDLSPEAKRILCACCQGVYLGGSFACYTADFGKGFMFL